MTPLRVKEIFQPDQAHHAARTVAATFDRSVSRVFAQQQVLRLIEKHREEWGVLSDIPNKKIVDHLLIVLPLKKVILDGPHHAQEFPRYLWREANPLEVAASVRSPRSYLCHSSALFVHGLVDSFPQELYVNYEQSPKPKPSGGLTQASLERAFQGKQRQSAFTLRYKKHVITVLSGKHTGDLEVDDRPIATGAKVRVTSLERTLIDVTVRPVYAGGVGAVLDAHRRAKGRVSIDKVITTLRKLDYVYPFHQAMGFYMQRAGYPQGHLAKLRAFGIDLDFYLAHGMKRTAYNNDWRLYHPADL